MKLQQKIKEILHLQNITTIQDGLVVMCTDVSKMSRVRTFQSKHFRVSKERFKNGHGDIPIRSCISEAKTLVLHE